ncbi:hypothetical protein ACGK9U_06590 [Mariniflexile sp. HNIBRBA6329]|uniref:hypothetical protein n=1 Tax=Mariniflexile sp. HNIBRBA6329 TaxID=3373088 RepID=UPI003745DD1D
MDYKKHLSLLLGLSLMLFFIWLGKDNYTTHNNKYNTYLKYKKDSTEYEQEIRLRNKHLQEINDEELIKFNDKNTLTSDLNEGYINASQGFEVHLEGIRWFGQWFNKNQDHGISKIGGRSDIYLNQLFFDPDFEKSGFPDLNVEVTQPKFFDSKNIFNELAERLNLVSIKSRVKDRKPIKTISLTTTPDKKKVMNVFLMEFDTFLRIEPSQDHDNENIGNLERHPLTNEKTNKIRRIKEYKSPRYGNVSIMLKFKPKNNVWYIADKDKNGVLVKNKNPVIGIAAVECINIYQKEEEKENKKIGVYLRPGSNLALYNSPEDLDKKFTITGINKKDVYYPVESSDYSSLINKDLFGKEKYSIIHISNFGSWDTGGWFSGSKYYQDLYHVKFLVHVFVIGEWDVQPLKIIKPESREQAVVFKPGLKNFLPNFGITFFGEIIYILGLVLAFYLIINFVIPFVKSFKSSNNN